MTAVVLARHWVCAKDCPSSAVTHDAATPHHRCRALAGLMVPLIPEGTRADVRPVERGDYIGRELVQTDANGRPVMAVTVERDEGQDTTVFAPCAQASRDEIKEARRG